MGEMKAVIAALEPLASEHRRPTPALNYLLGTALIREGRVKEGQALADRILSRGDSAEAHVMMGAAYLRAARFPDAIGEFERALALNPALPTANALIGQAKIESGDREGAMKAYQAELAIDANHFDANFELGVLLKEDRRTAEALPYFRQGGAPAPRFGRPGLPDRDGGTGAGQRGDGAAWVWSASYAWPRSSPRAHAGLATVYMKLGRAQDARRERDLAAALAAEAR